MIEFKAFAEPDANQYPPLAEFNGGLLLIEPLEVKQVATKLYGSKDMVVANVTVLEGEHAGEVYENYGIFASAVVNQLATLVGEGPMVCRVAEYRSKYGRDASKLEAPTPQDLALAQRVLRGNKRKTTPTPAVAPTGDAWADEAVAKF